MAEFRAWFEVWSFLLETPLLSAQTKQSKELRPEELGGQNFFVHTKSMYP